MTYADRLLAAAEARNAAQAAFDAAKQDLDEAQRVFAARRRQLADADAEVRAVTVDQ